MTKIRKKQFFPGQTDHRDLQTIVPRRPSIDTIDTSMDRLVRSIRSIRYSKKQTNTNAAFEGIRLIVPGFVRWLSSTRLRSAWLSSAWSCSARLGSAAILTSLLYQWAAWIDNFVLAFSSRFLWHFSWGNNTSRLRKLNYAE